MRAAALPVPRGLRQLQGRRQSFTYLLEQNVTSLDPQTASNSAAELVISSLFEGLCRIDEDGETIPGAARSWEANSDSTEFTFHLRRNAQWSDGTPLTAQDFVYGITRALSPATGSTPGDLLLIRGAKSFAAGEGDASTLGVVAEDEHTLHRSAVEKQPGLPRPHRRGPRHALQPSRF